MSAGERSDRRRWLCVVCGVVERDGSLLLVRQKAKDDPGEGWWTVPGGVVEAEETLEQALQRELLEETGLRVDHPGRVLWIVQTTNQSLTFVFAIDCDDVTTPGGVDPDDLVKEAAWVPQSVALERLGAVPARRMAEPAVAVLSGRAPEGSVWTYEVDADGVDHLRTALPG